MENLKDNTKEGIAPLKGLNSFISKDPNTLSLEDRQDQNILKYLDNSYSNKQTPIDTWNIFAPKDGLEIGNIVGDGSKYDKNITSASQLDNLEDFRSSQQPWYDQWANNIVNTGTIIGTTASDGIIGTAVGIIEAIAGNEGTWLERFANNSYSTMMVDWQTSVKDSMPTYLSNEYKQNQEEAWWKNIASSEFWGSSVVENLGFTAGMLLGSKGIGTLIQSGTKVAQASNLVNRAAKTLQASGKYGNKTIPQLERLIQTGKINADIPKELIKASNYINNVNLATSGISLGLATASESRMEAIHTYNDILSSGEQLLNSEEHLYEAKSQILEQLEQEVKEGKIANLEGDELITELNNRLSNRLSSDYQRLEREAKDASSDVFLTNLPILLASNTIQWGKFMSKGFNSQKGFLNTLKASANSFANNNTSRTLQGIERLAMKEGTALGQEGAELVLKNTSKAAIAGRVLGKGIITPALTEGNEEMLQGVASQAAEKVAINRTFSGMSINPYKNEEYDNYWSSFWNTAKEQYSDIKNYEEFAVGAFTGILGMPTFSRAKGSNKWEGGLIGNIIEEIESTNRLNQSIETINKRIQSPDFIAMYKGQNRHNLLEDIKIESLDADSKFNYLNAENLQMVSDVIMFEELGQTNSLIDMIKSNISELESISPEEVEEKAEDFKEVFRNKETNVSLYDGYSSEDIIKDRIKQLNKSLESINNIREITNNTKTIVGDKVSKEALEEFVFMNNQIHNFETRAEDIKTLLVDQLNKIKIPGLRRKLFPINLDNQEKRLTFDELITGLSNEELVNYIYGDFTTGSIGNEYLQSLFNVLAINEDSGETTKKSIAQDILKIEKSLSRKNASPKKIKERKERIKNLNKEFKKVEKLLENSPNAKAIMNDFSDLLAIQTARINLVNSYNKLLQNPQLIQKQLDEEKEDILQEQDNIKQKSVTDSLKEATTLDEIRSIYNTEVEKGNNNIDRIISKMSISDNQDFSQLVADFRQVENLQNEIKYSNIAKNTSDDIMDGVNQLYNIIKNRATNYEELTNPSITQEDLGELGDRNNIYPQDMREEIKNTLLDILHEIKDRNNKYNNISNKLTPAPKKEETRVEPEVSEKPISNVTTKQIESDNNNIQKDIDTKNNQALVDKVWNNGTFEIDIDVYNRTNRIEDQSNPLFAPAVQYLKHNGAFDYINSGKLRRGDKVHFIAHKPYWDFLKDGANSNQIAWVDNNKPLLIAIEDSKGTIQEKGKTYQVLGTFNSKLNPKLHDSVLSNQGESITSKIQQNQEKVKELPTLESNTYKIEEEDGVVYEYERVTNSIGNNWVGPTSNNGNTALSVGSTVDSITRDFFSNKEVLKPDNMSEEAFNNLITSLENINNTIKSRGERFLTNNIVLFGKFSTPEGLKRIAGEVDIISVDNKGNYKIYDVKTSKYSFTSDNYNKPSKYYPISPKEQHRKQVSVYKNLFENQYGVEVSSLGILPIHVQHTNGFIQTLNKEAGIYISYNSEIETIIPKNKNISKTDKNTDIVTTVANVTPGRLEFNTDKLLSSLQGKTPWGEDIEMLFGIATDTGQLETNLDSIEYSVFNVTSTNTDYSNSGRLYLLTKSATGDYIPTAVRAKTLNEVDFGKDTPLFNELRRSVQEVAKSAITNNEEAVANAVHDLRNILYVGSKAGLSINLRSEPFGNRTEFNLVLTKKDGSTEIVNVGHSELREVDSEKFSDNGIETIYNFNTEEQVTNNLMNALSKMKAPFQINKNNINGKWNVRQSLDYNKVLIDSDILTTNLSNNYVRGAYFVMNPLDNNLAEVHNTNTAISEKNATPATQTVTQGTNNTFGTEVNTELGPFLLNNKGEVTTVRGIHVIDGRMVTTVKAKNYLDGLSKKDLDSITYYGQDFTANDGVFFPAEKYYLFPSGAVFTGKDVFPPSSPQAKAVERLKRDKIKPEVKPEFTQEDATSVPFIQEDDAYSGTIEEVPFFSNTTEQGNTEATPPSPQRERKRPSRNLALNQDISETTKEDIEKKIQENKDFQKDNCNGIAPV